MRQAVQIVAQGGTAVWTGVVPVARARVPIPRMCCALPNHEWDHIPGGGWLTPQERLLHELAMIFVSCGCSACTKSISSICCVGPLKGQTMDQWKSAKAKPQQFQHKLIFLLKRERGAMLAKQVQVRHQHLRGLFVTFVLTLTICKTKATQPYLVLSRCLDSPLSILSSDFRAGRLSANPQHPRLQDTMTAMQMNVWGLVACSMWSGHCICGSSVCIARVLYNLAEAVPSLLLEFRLLSRNGSSNSKTEEYGIQPCIVEVNSLAIMSFLFLGPTSLSKTDHLGCQDD
eukprot:5492703-Amphidinium_carterae.1